MKVTTSAEKIRSEERGYLEENKAQSWYCFSFGPYINPRRLNFGALFAFNQYQVEPKGKLPLLSCKNTEILLFVLEGELTYQIDQNERETLIQGECLRLSAGMGLTYQVRNRSKNATLSFLELWIHPSQRDLSPSQEKKQTCFFERREEEKGTMTLLASKFATPLLSSEGVFIPQEVAMYMGRLLPGETRLVSQSFYRGGFFFFVFQGDLLIEREEGIQERLSQGESLLIKESQILRLSSLVETSFMSIQVSLSTL